MERYLIDTNVICDYFSASIADSGMTFMDGIIDAVPNISVIVQIELLCWKSNDFVEQQVRDFIDDSIVFEINTMVIQHCVKLRRERSIKTPDAIIAGTALCYGC